MTSRPKGITIIIILYSLTAVASGFGILSTEKAGHLIEEQYGSQLKLLHFFDYDKDLAILVGVAETMIIVGLIALLLNRSSKARIGIILHESYVIGSLALTIILPIAFFPQEHPYYPFSQSKIWAVFGLVIPVLIKCYCLKSSTIQYF